MSLVLMQEGWREPLTPSRAAMRAYCFVLSQEVVAYFPIKISWFATKTVRIELTLHMGRFRAIADGLQEPDAYEARGIAEMMRHFTPAPELILEPEDYDRFFPATKEQQGDL